MSDECGFCYKQITGRAVEYGEFHGVHPECYEEFVRRQKSDICVKCGAKPRVDVFACDSCDINTAYEGYDGGFE